MAAPPTWNRATLERQQRAGLEWTGRGPLTSPGDAARFLEKVGIALRYQATKGLPLASLRSAAGGENTTALTRSIELTNHLIGHAVVVEVNVVANRLTLVHRSVVPLLYRLVRRGRPATDLDGVSLDARAAYALLRERRHVTVGDVRRHLGKPVVPRNDPGWLALAELQRALLVDRGPFEIAKTGIPYLSHEGYPYRVLHDAHADLVRAAGKTSSEKAADGLIAAYLAGAVFATPRKLASLFRAFLTAGDIQAAIARLVRARLLVAGNAGRQTVVVLATHHDKLPT